MKRLLLRGHDYFTDSTELEEASLDKVIEAFAVSLFSIAIAELGDKTQIGLITLSATIRKPAAVFLGMFSGFFIVAGSAVFKSSKNPCEAVREMKEIAVRHAGRLA